LFQPATAVLAAALLLGGCASAEAESAAPAGPAGPRVALLPLQGMLAPVEEVQRLKGLLRQAFAEELGDEALVSEAEVEAVLAADRIRVVDTLTPETAARVAAGLGGARLVTSTLVYARGNDDPAAAVLLRSFDAEGHRLGSRLWLRLGSDDQDLFGLEGSEDFTTLFERGAPRIASGALRDLERRPSFERVHVAVIPFESNFDDPDSGPLAGLVAAHLLEEDFAVAVTEPADLTQAFLAARIRYLRLTRPADIQAIGRAAGVRWLLTGVVLDFELSDNPAVPSTASVLLRVFDVESGRTVASTLAQNTGDEGEILFGAGLAPHPILNLAEAVRSGLDDLEPTWQGS
jgi:hypothetical protein